MTLCTNGFCCSSGRDMNSSTLKLPLLSRSSFLNLRKTRSYFFQRFSHRLPRRLISSASKVAHMSRGRDDSLPMVTAGPVVRLWLRLRESAAS